MSTDQEWDVPHTHILAKARKDGSPSFQAQIKAPGHGHEFRTFDTWEDAAEHILSRLKTFAHEDRQKANAETMAGANGEGFSEERLRMTCQAFLNTATECTKNHRTLMPTVLKLAGNPTIGQLKPSWIKAYIARARQTPSRHKKVYAYMSISHHLSLISVVLRWRAEELDITTPSFKVPLKYFENVCRSEGADGRDGKYFTQRTRRFEEGEEEMLMAEIALTDERRRRHWELLIQFAIETAARQKELLTAKWSEISPSSRSWIIPHHKTEERRMRLTEKGRDILAELRELRVPHSDRLFHTLPSAAWVSSNFRGIARRAGLLDFRFHDLRHEGVSRLVASNHADMDVLMRQVGHSSKKMTRRYTQLSEDELELLMTTPKK